MREVLPLTGVSDIRAECLAEKSFCKKGCHGFCCDDRMTGKAAYEVRINAQGRVVVPLPVRAQVHLPKGGELILYLDGERTVMERKGEARSRLLALGAQLAPGDVNLTDEFLQDRREVDE